MTLWIYCPNPDCDSRPIDQDLSVSALPGDECFWCGTALKPMPPEAYEEEIVMPQWMHELRIRLQGFTPEQLVRSLRAAKGAPPKLKGPVKKEIYRAEFRQRGIRMPQ